MGFLEDERIKCAPVLVFANQQEMPGAASSTEIAERLELSRLTTQRQWHVQQCNVLTDEGIMDGFNWMADTIKGRKLQYTPKAISHV